MPFASLSPRALRNARLLLLLLGIFSLPLTCCSATYWVDVLSSGNLVLDLFEGETVVHNLSAERLYLTPLTTTRGYPEVILQYSRLRMRDFPIPPGGSQSFTCDSADFPLSGFAVCRAGGECRLLEESYTIRAFEDLPPLPAEWLQAVRKTPRSNPVAILLMGGGLFPLAAFALWFYLGKRARA